MTPELAIDLLGLLVLAVVLARPRVWQEERYSSSPFPERRARMSLFGVEFTLWRWDA